MKEEKVTDNSKEIKIREVIKSKMHEMRISLKDLSQKQEFHIQLYFLGEKGAHQKT